MFTELVGVESDLSLNPKKQIGQVNRSVVGEIASWFGEWEFVDLGEMFNGISGESIGVCDGG